MTEAEILALPVHEFATVIKDCPLLMTSRITGDVYARERDAHGVLVAVWVGGMPGSPDRISALSPCTIKAAKRYIEERISNHFGIPVVLAERLKEATPGETPHHG